MDALFDLPRRKSAGIIHQSPLLADLFFCDQYAVHEFVAKGNSYTTRPEVSI